ncbi:alpha/beta fold hydrolase [Xylanimonas protaetiae]|uniref:Alpha/beta fold hydrolase n=1 Tax=Xylanimonas protaetiae TaxID=2509457 RepID=A0A4P6F774_9MICO|nr:alpha/beta fold hydrolase [Xylanimonas protaetiae]QAY71534.1 alpha/beta fold hydrolase [Xylanimonas protaetiae]
MTATPVPGPARPRRRRRSRVVGLVVAAVLVVLVGGAGIAYVVADATRAPLDDAARSQLLADGKADTFVETGGGVMHVRLSGPQDGPVVLLVHGAVVGGFAWANWVELLAAAGYRVVAPDLLGYGYSDRPDVDYTQGFYVDQLRDLLDGLGVDEPVHIVGASLGGAIVADFAAAHPERVATVGLMAPAGLGRYDAVAPALKLPVLGDWAFRVLGARIVTQQMADAYAGSPDRDAMLRWMGEQSRFRGFGEGILNTLRHYDFMAREESFDAIGRAGVPVFAAWGTEDDVHPYAWSQRLLDRVPQTELLTIDGAGHAITFGRADDVLRSYLPFLQRHAATG